jgi:predicted ribosome quality control (RQC) complex YloA/Tae2 family protein
VSELSGFEVLVLAKEIDSSLRGAYINNIYTFGASQLVRLRKPGSEDTWLVVSPKKGVWISTMVSEREETAEFTSKLRGELERAKFSGASQSDLDRVFLLEFKGTEDRTLVVELMPPGNILVIDGEGRVRLALSEVRSEARRIARGGMYTPPKQNRMSPSDVGPEEVKRMLSEESTLGKAIGRHVGLPRKYVADALNRLQANDGTPSAEMTGREEEIAGVLNRMVELAGGSPAPCVCDTPAGQELFAFHPIGLRAVAEAETMSELCDRYLLAEALAPQARVEPEESKRLELQATVAKLRAESESLRAKAVEAREAAKTARTSPLAEAIKTVNKAGVKTPRDPASSEAAASALFSHAKWLEAKSEANLEAAARLEKRAQKAPRPKSARTRPLAKRKGEWYEKFRWFVTAEGRLAIGGRDAQTNSVILGRHTDTDDTIYHADLFGSPFFVLKGGAAQSEEEAREVAQATVIFSSAWKTGLGSADAYWVRPDQVSSAAPSGEYLARGSYSIRGKKNFMPKMMVELALGVDREGRVTAGPEAAIRRACDHYVVLVPHNEKASETAKRVLQDLAAAGAPSPTLDEVQRALPAGGGKIIRKV